MTLARAIEAGYDVDAIVTDARELQASGEVTITTSLPAQPSNAECPFVPIQPLGRIRRAQRR
jgi:hypothetical protein